MPKTKHGMFGTAEYRAWASMKQRCLNPNDKDFSRYGGRGIKVCERWITFENFLEDVGLRPSSAYSIDRFPDPDGNYDPGNVRWATDEQQNRNRPTMNVVLIFDGQRRTAAEWSELLGLKRYTVYRRVSAGWTVRDALMLPGGSTPSYRVPQQCKKGHSLSDATRARMSAAHTGVPHPTRRYSKEAS